MSTFKSLVDQIEMALSGYVYDQAEQTYLTSAIDGTNLSLIVDEPSLISRGIVQVDDEMMWVKSVDKPTRTATVSPFGRGYMSSSPTTHAIGARVVDNPLFPRGQIKTTVNAVIDNMYPDLYVLKTTKFPFVAARATYALPADVRQVTQVHWETVGPSKCWLPVNRWKFDPRADQGRFPTGRSVDVWSMIIPGRDVRVDYMARPDLLVADADDFATKTGLGDYVEQAVMYGACYKMAGWLDTPRLQTRAVETSQRSAYVETGAAIDVSKYFYALYQEALNKARTRFLQENPTVLHFERY